MKTNLFLLLGFVLLSIFQQSSPLEAIPEEFSLEEEETVSLLPKNQERHEAMQQETGFSAKQQMNELEELNTKKPYNPENSDATKELKTIPQDHNSVITKNDESSSKYDSELQPEELEIEFGFEE